MKSRIPKCCSAWPGARCCTVLDQAAHLQARSAIVITGHGATEVQKQLPQARRALPASL